MENQIEIWKKVKDYPDYYVSNLGNVKSLKLGKERILKAGVTSNGYLSVGLCEQKQKSFKVHQLVAIAFLNHTPNNMVKVINHIDSNKLNNNVSNLEIVTQRQNISVAEIKRVSEYIGVSFVKSTKKWRARIKINGTEKYLGAFASEIEASEAYQNELLTLKQ